MDIYLVLDHVGPPLLIAAALGYFVRRRIARKKACTQCPFNVAAATPAARR